MAGGVGDREAAFARAVDQVGRGVGQVLHVGVRAILLHHPRRADVAVLADERVDLRLLAEPLQAGGDDRSARRRRPGPSACDRRPCWRPRC